MSIGIVSLSTTPKKEPSGSPFTAGSARNGTSIDSTGRVVLGNDVGEAGAPAQLLNNREIITEDAALNLFGLILNSIVTGITTRLDGQLILINGAAFTFPSITVQGADFSSPSISAIGTDGATSSIVASTAQAGGSATIAASAGAGSSAALSVSTDADNLLIRPTGSGNIEFVVGGVFEVWKVNTATLFTQIAAGTMVADNGALLQVSGTTTYRYLQQSQGAGAYNIDRDLDSGKIFTNSAAATFNIFNSVGANFRGGFIFRLNIANVAGATIQAQAGEIIRFGSLATSAGGTISSTDVGAFITLVLTANGWVTESFLGAWVLT